MSYSSANVLVGIVAALHVLNSIVEMLFWRRPERLALNTEDAEKVAPIVANAGLGTTASWPLDLSVTGDGSPIEILFLTCVIVAGIFGAVTLKRTTLTAPEVPGAIAMIAVWMARTA